MRPAMKVAIATLLPILFSASEGLSQDPVPAAKAPPALEEAQTRARLLHSSLGGTLEVMHRDFFRKNESRAIPSASLEDVFRKIEQEWGITLRWLASEATVMNADHTARDEFQKAALLKITRGEKEVMAVENGTLRFAGSIILRNECLKCHVRNRQSLEDRFAALEIRMAVQGVPPPKGS
ncbi:MAG: DUF3365 domain-containing protein [Verrucomicrobiaceae bacterium]|nr:MAG: DUF3365 domain-containing protein [Verrucomicrobiaceae bacterium]